MIEKQKKRTSPAFAWKLITALLIFSYFPKTGAADVNLWPLYESSADETTVLYPFYVQDKDSLMLFPFYYRTDAGKEQHILWPFIKISNGRLARITPFWFSEEDGSFFLFPLVMKRSDSFLSVFPPVYYEDGGDALAVLPFFSTSSRVDSSNGETRKDLSVLWPLYSKEEVRASNGDVVSKKRRWLLFTDERSATGSRRFSFLGIPITEG